MNQIRALKRGFFGALAQLGAHNTGSVGVRGSNPLCSTKTKEEGNALLFGFAEEIPMKYPSNSKNSTDASGKLENNVST